MGNEGGRRKERPSPKGTRSKAVLTRLGISCLQPGAIIPLINLRMRGGKGGEIKTPAKKDFEGEVNPNQGKQIHQGLKEKNKNGLFKRRYIEGRGLFGRAFYQKHMEGGGGCALKEKDFFAEGYPR